MTYHQIQRANLRRFNTTRAMLCVALFLALIAPCLGWLLPQRVYAERAQGDVAFVDIMGSAQPPGFSPSLITVHLYDTVEFLNQSQPAVPYAVVADDGSFASPAIAPGQQWNFTVNSPGAFEYHEVDSTPRMVGAIVVVDGATPLLPSPIPAAQATALSDIHAGQMPPDTVWQQGPAPQTTRSGKVSGHGSSTTTTKTSPWMFWVSFASTAALVIALEAGAFVLVKGSILGVRWLRAHRKRDDDDDVEEDEDI